MSSPTLDRDGDSAPKPPATAALSAPSLTETLKLATVTVIWLALAKWLDRLGAAVIPDAWKRHVPIQTFLMACQVTAAAVGLGLALAILARPRAELGLLTPRARHLVTAALVAPAVFVGAAAVALQIALPTLLAEARLRGPQASRENAGAFGRALTGGALLPTLLWGVVLAAITEELLFRGALFSLLERVVRHLGTRSAGTTMGAPPPNPPLAMGAPPWSAGLAAAVGAAVIFALLHGDLQGGVGIVRVVSTLCLGLACGVARVAARSVAAPVVVHLVHNAIAVGQTRRWFAGSSPPSFEALPIPDPLLGLAVGGLVAGAALAIAAQAARRRAAQERALRLDE
jgi:membrane protease YdiL (CAAX protease family)